MMMKAILFVLGAAVAANAHDPTATLREFVKNERRNLRAEENKCKYYKKSMAMEGKEITDAVGADQVSSLLCNDVMGMIVENKLRKPAQMFVGEDGPCQAEMFLEYVEATDNVGVPIIGENGKMNMENCKVLVSGKKDETRRKLFQFGGLICPAVVCYDPTNPCCRSSVSPLCEMFPPACF